MGLDSLETRRRSRGNAGPMSSRAAIYVCVSTTEQTTDNQERELRARAERLEREVVRVYADTASGARSGRALTKVPTGAHRREFDALLIWSLDRLTREGIFAVLGYLPLRAGRGRGVGDRVGKAGSKGNANGVDPAAIGQGKEICLAPSARRAGQLD
jgi:hypothetical protein